MRLHKFAVIIDIIHKFAMIGLVILMIGALWQMNNLMTTLINEFHLSYEVIEAIRKLMDKSIWF